MENQPDTATDLPKTFKELAQKLFGNIDPSEIKDYDYSPEDSAAIRTEEMAQLEELEKLFGPQDRASQQAAVDGAKNVIEGSKLTSTLMKKLFQNQDQASAPSVFDNYEY
ncbi:hypothetical protein O0L34_g4175 [Tuta absoluta]|nr:hypothetical protein O0L34_g4175 [Tuta absoluta]